MFTVAQFDLLDGKPYHNRANSEHCAWISAIIGVYLFVPCEGPYCLYPTLTRKRARDKTITRVKRSQINSISTIVAVLRLSELHKSEMLWPATRCRIPTLARVLQSRVGHLSSLSRTYLSVRRQPLDERTTVPRGRFL